ncbi:hypothetical protein K461DRAFT_296555 [Myriangium duriaei CBS 260.36]|uniref:histidine kinase n=1 Tax=Myriangium duriaei CBS 260.36 TaxID=1168546 RepID=A0A9P4MEH6_9PEZI|nr:hypothetical protein K461DRAFT_296555 [Myriangium duriaei CBS 260.36]
MTQTCHQDPDNPREPVKNVFDLAYASGCISLEYYRLLSNVNWEQTSFGPCSSWPPEIRNSVSLTLSNPDPCAVLVGEDRVMLYNERYPTLIKKLHPQALGQSAKITFHPFWEQFEVLMVEAEQTGQTQTETDKAVQLYRSDDYLEEAYFSFAYAPIRDVAGRFLGIYNNVTESTTEVVSKRRMTNLLRISEMTSATTVPNQFWQSILQAFDFEASEVPFAAIYTRRGGFRMHDSLDASLGGDNDLLTLEGSMGWQARSMDVPVTIDISLASRLSFAIRRSIKVGPTLIKVQTLTEASDEDEDNEDDVLSSEVLRAIICPLTLNASLQYGTWIIVGVKDLRPYDNDYQAFVNLVARQIATGASSVAHYAEERRRLELTAEHAEREKERLAKELAIQRREAEESAWRFLEFAKHSPVGVFIFGPDGTVKFANEAWYRLLGITYKQRGQQIWREYVHPDDVGSVDSAWGLLINQGQSHAHFEFRVRRNPVTGSVNEEDCGHVSSTSFAELDQDGNVKAVTGILIDNTIHKAHEREVAERLTSALDAKKAQENFMDMVSHEMRNPLNAIIQCAEEISQLLQPATPPTSTFLSSAAATEALDLINTILYCGTHQRSIIDDVLTISKLDSNLLTLSPTASNPLSVAHQVLQIYSSEIRSSGIEVSVTPDQSLSHKNIIFDNGRVLQILINLVGNAVKFLKGTSSRKLSVSVSVSKDRPRPDKVLFIPSGKQHQNLHQTDNGAHRLYVYYSVVDSGPGLTPTEMNNLFGRFKQASPRTHAQYGGSGLGLFISRELAELHGGEIGLASELGKGCTFAFYVQGHESVQLPGSAVPSSKRPLPQAMMQTQSPRHLGPARPPKETFNHVHLSSAPARLDMTVLVVEDNIVNQNILTKQLRRAGFDVVTADDGQQALSRLLAIGGIQLTLCDLEMPVMDGLTCVKHVREMREDGRLPYIPMVAVTGNARLEQIKIAKDAGFDDVVCKPYSIANLISLMKDTIMKTRR